MGIHGEETHWDIPHEIQGHAKGVSDLSDHPCRDISDANLDVVVAAPLTSVTCFVSSLQISQAIQNLGRHCNGNLRALLLGTQ